VSTVGRRVRDGVLSVVLLAFPALVFHANFKTQDKINVLDKVVLKIAAPLQAVVGWAVSGIGNTWKRYLFLVDVQSENEELRKSNRDLRAALAEKTRLAAHAAHLEKLLGLRRDTPAETVAARVVGAKMSPYFRVSRLQLEDTSGSLRANLPVIGVVEGSGAPGAVVGLISKVYSSGGKTFADLKLAVDPRSKIDVKVGVGGARGVLHGMQGESAYTCKLERVDRADEVKVGDIVVTSGIGGFFPQDLLIGKVSKVVKLDYALYQEVEVEPFIDFSKLDEVLIILAEPPPPDPDAADKLPAVPAHGPVPAR
jgi:rod shape-determining protein MreC